MIKLNKISIVVVLALSAQYSFSQVLRNDPKRPVGAIAKDLGVTTDQFVACFNRVNPTPGGGRPTSERAHANKSALLPCLQAANPTITNDRLDEVMDRYRPGGREAQRPTND